MTTYVGFDTLLRWNGNTVIGQVRDITGPGTQQAAINVTTRESRDDEYLGGLRDGTEVTFDIVYDPALATQTILTTALANQTTHLVELLMVTPTATLPDGWRFFAMVAGFTPKAPLADALTADVTLRTTLAVAEIDYLIDHDANNLVDELTNYLIA